MSESAPEAAGDLASPRPPWRLMGERLWSWSLTPAFAFTALWLLGSSLAQVHVLAIQTNWSPTVWLVMIEVPIAFVGGSLLASRAVGARARIAPAGQIAGAVPLRWLWALVAVGWLGLAYQFAQAHEIPLLTAHIDRARTALNGGAAALLTDALTVSAAAAIATPRRVLSRPAIPCAAIAGVSLAGWALAGGRSTIALPIAIGLLARWLYWRRPSLRSLAAGAILVGGFLSFWFYLRTGQDPPTQAFPAELYGSVLPSTPRLLAPLLPLHFALALNFEALARVIDYFPAHMAYGHGAYDAWALHAVLPARSLGTVSAGLSGPWIVSTAAGPLWADGGPLVVAAGMLLIGALTTAPHATFRRTHRFSDALLAAYFLYIAAFCVYTDLLTQYKDWVVVALGLWAIGRIAERAPPEPDRPRRRRSAAALRERPPRGVGFPPQATAAAVVLLAVIVGAAVIAESERGHEPSNPAPEIIAPRAQIPLRGARLAPSDVVLPAGEHPSGASTIWAVRRLGARAGLRLTVFTYERSGSYRGVTRVLPVTVGPGTRFAAAALAGRARLYLITPGAGRVTVRAVDPSTPGAATEVGRARVAPRNPGTVRSYFVAPWSGTAPDLFVVDRGSRRYRLEVRVYRFTTGGARLVMSAKAPVRGLAPSAWVVQVDPSAPRPALVLIARRAHGADVEVHVLPGASGYRRFSIQERLALSSAQLGGRPVLVGDSLGSPSVLALARTHGQRIYVFPIPAASPP